MKTPKLLSPRHIRISRLDAVFCGSAALWILHSCS
jgi:hypothetical protein